MTHCHTSLLFVNMPLNKEGRILVKRLYLFKGYTAWKLLK